MGADRFDLWLGEASFECLDAAGLGGAAKVRIDVPGDFVAQRLERQFATELRAAALSTFDLPAQIEVVARPRVAPTPAPGPAVTKTRRGDRRERPPTRRRGTASLSQVLQQPGSVRQPRPDADPEPVAAQPRAKNPAEQNPPPVTSDPVADDDSATLDAFISGPCNQFAFQAVAAVLANPAMAAPLLLHGPPGCGKTHLLSAMTKELRRYRRFRRVVMLTAERFTNDFIGSVKSIGLRAFRDRYRDVDALLIDDIHFLAAKQATLREMLYTIDSLLAAGKPLILSSNAPPSMIRDLSVEVAGRLTSGLTCPVGPLDEATRLSLLKRLTTRRCPMQCGEELVAAVAAALPGDARGIFGVANLIAMLQRMNRRDPTVAEVRAMAGGLMRNQRIAPTLSSIEAAVCETFGLQPGGLQTKARTKRVSEPRMLAMYLARTETGCALSEIAGHFGRRSHTGVIAAQKKVGDWIGANSKIGGNGGDGRSVQEAIATVKARLRIA